jgi:hypothetical protein
MSKQHSGALSKPLLKPADIPEFIEDFPGVIPLDKIKKVMLQGADESDSA